MIVSLYKILKQTIQKHFFWCFRKTSFVFKPKLRFPPPPPPLLYTTLYMNNLSPNLYLFCNFHFNQHFFTFHLNKIQDKSKIKIRRKIYFIMFGGLQKKTCMFFYKKHFHKPWATSSWDWIRNNNNLSYQKGVKRKRNILNERIAELRKEHYC